MGIGNMSHMKDPGVYKAALVVIGNEILSGRTQDTNTAWIAEKSNRHGIVLVEVRVVPDIEEKIIEAVNALRHAVDYVFTTGGIGPTHDDITAASIAKAFGVKLERNDEAFRMLEKHYGIEQITPPRAKMSFVPEGARLIPNPVSAAPGFAVENVYVMAGIPRIMQAMFDHVLSDIPSGSEVLSNTISCSLTESMVADSLSALQKKNSDIEIGSYPHFRGGMLGLSLVLRSTDRVRLKIVTQDLVQMIHDHGGEAQALGLQVPIEGL